MVTARLRIRSEGQVKTEFWLRSEYVTARLCVRPGDWIKTRFESIIPSFAEAQCCFRQYKPGVSLARLSISHPVTYWRLNLYAGAPGECNPAWVDTKMEIRPPGISKYTSSIGDLLPGTRIEFLPMGEVRGILVTREFLAAGKNVQIFDEDGIVLFSGKVIQAAHDAESDTWTLTATDDASEAGLDKKISMARYPDIVDALPYDIEDLSGKTLFPTVPVDGITVRYWLGVLESLRNAHLFFDPELERYVLSDRLRMWTIKDVLSFTQRVDASQYFNVIVAEQSDSWEEEAERKTTVSEYGDYKLTVDRAGEKIFKATLKSATEILAQDEFEYNELDQVTKTVSRKGISTTTTVYTVQQGENPYIRSEVSTTVVAGSETPFTERRQKKASLLTNPDGTLLVLLNEKREWFEKKQEVTHE